MPTNVERQVVGQGERRAQLRRVSTDLCYCSGRLEREREREGKLPTRLPTELHESEREILRPLLEDGFQIVGTGAGRCVLRFPAASSLHDHVVKLARFGDGLTNSGIVQNHREVMLSLRHGESDRWPLVPVVDYHRDDFRWLVMRYGESIDDHSEETRERMVRTVQNRLRMLPDVIREVREPNVVLVDGDPLLADYGRPEGI